MYLHKTQLWSLLWVAYLQAGLGRQGSSLYLQLYSHMSKGLLGKVEMPKLKTESDSWGEVCLPDFLWPLDCSPPGSSVHGISQTRILEWVVISSSREYSWPKVWTCISWVSCIDRWILHHLSHQENPRRSVLLLNEPGKSHDLTIFINKRHSFCFHRADEGKNKSWLETDLAWGHYLWMV